MTTISVPLTPELEKALDYMVKETGASRAGVMRKALEKYREEEAINHVIIAMNEAKEGKVIRGDLEEILMKMD